MILSRLISLSCVVKFDQAYAQKLNEREDYQVLKLQKKKQSKYKSLTVCRRHHVFHPTDKRICRTLKQILALYEAASGQRFNTDKSSISFVAKTLSTVRNGVKNVLEITKEGGVEKYLDLPEHLVERSKSKTGARDSYIWYPAKSGIYSKKSGYASAIATREHDQDRGLLPNSFNWYRSVWLSPPLQNYSCFYGTQFKELCPPEISFGREGSCRTPLAYTVG